MSRLVVAVLAILGLCAASPASEEACRNFLKDSKFDSSALDGPWTVVYFWPFNTVSNKYVFQFLALSAEQVTAYKNETSNSYPAISWEKVKYSASVNNDGTEKGKTFLMEIDDDTGYVRAIMARELRLGRLDTSNFAYKQVGEYLAVKFCDDTSENAYLIQKGTEHVAADVERVASSIASTISRRQGGVVAFLKPQRTSNVREI